MECTISNIETKKEIDKNIDKSDKNIDKSDKKIDKLEINKIKELRDTIANLEICEQTEILKIIEKYKIKYTENKNGIFINMNKLSSEVIAEIELFIEFFENNYKKNLI